MASQAYAAYTENVINATGPNASSRVKKVLPILFKHLHAAVIEAEITFDELIATLEFLGETGKMTTEKRQEFVLVSDILGVSSLVDMLSHNKLTAKDPAPSTPSAVLGPFYVHGVPPQPLGTTVVRYPEPDGVLTHIFGRVKSSVTGAPIPGAIIDVWEGAPDGEYSTQTPHKGDYHCRGRFIADESGRYSVLVLKPVAYPIPTDGTGGKLLKLLDRHCMRPAHVHFMVIAPGYKTLVTQVFDRKSDYLQNDAVFAVKESLIVDFVPAKSPAPSGPNGEKPVLELEYDLVITEEKKSEAVAAL
ncbi:aromatic compound dioxygenase [Gonapodya prolifera JEL478]|uniref:Aromatic compound dioxygenase n=1 Tax=Gonapodya prolifera (strain JEL478) TaxID=1344416 RepID=A0A139AZX5_GONPJ|nr:aromatic compound dioxygenase [Gonapodya prolifera JEL478]|eukprot:KXS22279.1 aromatic compound dioxygenase [Gonapodya prolifera JEL478]